MAATQRIVLGADGIGELPGNLNRVALILSTTAGASFRFAFSATAVNTVGQLVPADSPPLHLTELIHGTAIQDRVAIGGAAAQEVFATEFIRAT